jgi:hypothetical protein
MFPEVHPASIRADIHLMAGAPHSQSGLLAGRQREGQPQHALAHNAF